MCKTTNCHIRDMKDGDVYCGRGKGVFWNPESCIPGVKGYWGNPIAVNKRCMMCGNAHKTGGSTLKCYEWYLREKLKNNMIFKREFFELKGQRLVCFCKPGPCHTDVMIQYLEGEKVIHG